MQSLLVADACQLALLNAPHARRYNRTLPHQYTLSPEELLQNEHSSRTVFYISSISICPRSPTKASASHRRGSHLPLTSASKKLGHSGILVSQVERPPAVIPLQGSLSVQSL